VQAGPFKGRGLISCSVLGPDRIFVSRTAANALSVARLADGAWRTDELGTGEFLSDILTASGEAMFCFAIRKDGEKYDIVSWRFADGKWSPAVTAASTSVALNQVAAPMFSPPDYAAVFWDQKRPEDRASSFVKFLRVPNR
jgi:hypothetical protein